MYFRYSPGGLFFIETTTLLQHLHCQTLQGAVQACDTFPGGMQNGR